MYISRQIPIFLLILLSGIEQTFACISDGGPMGLVEGGIIILVPSILGYFFYKLLCGVFLKSTDTLRLQKGKKIIIRAIVILGVLYFINSTIQWQLSLLC